MILISRCLTKAAASIPSLSFCRQKPPVKAADARISTTATPLIAAATTPAAAAVSITVPTQQLSPNTTQVPVPVPAQVPTISTTIPSVTAATTAPAAPTVPTSALPQPVAQPVQPQPAAQPQAKQTRWSRGSILKFALVSGALLSSAFGAAYVARGRFSNAGMEPNSGNLLGQSSSVTDPQEPYYTHPIGPERLIGPEKPVHEIMREINAEACIKNALYTSTYSISPYRLGADFTTVGKLEQTYGAGRMTGYDRQLTPHEQRRFYNDVAHAISHSYEGYNTELAARKACEGRHALRLYTRLVGTELAYWAAKLTDLYRYGNTEGLTCDQIFDKYNNNYQKIIKSAGKPNKAVDKFAEVLDKADRWPAKHVLRAIMLTITILAAKSLKKCCKPKESSEQATRNARITKRLAEMSGEMKIGKSSNSGCSRKSRRSSEVAVVMDTIT